MSHGITGGAPPHAGGGGAREIGGRRRNRSSGESWPKAGAVGKWFLARGGVETLKRSYVSGSSCLPLPRSRGGLVPGGWRQFGGQLFVPACTGSPTRQ